VWKYNIKPRHQKWSPKLNATTLQMYILGWLQGRVVHFLCHNLVFCRMVCIYMLLTWHENINFLNLWLDLDFQLTKQTSIKIYATYIHQIYSNRFMKLEKWTSLLFVPLYTCIFVYEFYLGYIIGIQYMIC